ncbi:hypothetical protein E2C01_096570 [Portunus trituberculatus]|uniref:Uncharacterized protein n=1 Tax=Portunus trituberculatus TaxID=210409 RepID=A0A5B7K768_PORTR|nr:hypothetical protein [Portunus trituberculatus]
MNSISSQLSIISFRQLDIPNSTAPQTLTNHSPFTSAHWEKNSGEIGERRVRVMKQKLMWGIRIGKTLAINLPTSIDPS